MSHHVGDLTPGEQLSELLAGRKMSRRQFSLALARERGIDYETAKSSVYKWLRDAHTITGANRPAVAKILGIGEDEVPGATSVGLAAKVDQMLEILSSRSSWLAEVDAQLAAQTALLESLSAMALALNEAVAELSGLVAELREVAGSRRPAARRSKPA